MPIAIMKSLDFATESAAIARLLEQKRYVPAERRARAMIARSPEKAEAWEMLSVVLWRQGSANEAIAALEEATCLAPVQPVYRFNLAQLRRMDGATEAAEADYRRVVELAPGYFEAWLNLGVTLESQARTTEAIECYRKAVDATDKKECGPNIAEACGNLAAALARLEQWEEAEEWHKRALDLAPQKAELYCNYGRMLNELRRLREAEACCRRAVALKPGLTEAWSCLGEALHLLGRGPEASEAFRYALRLDPKCHEARTGLIFSLAHEESVSPAVFFAEHLEFGRMVRTGDLPVQRHHENSRDPERRLRIGLVSADLHHHAMAYFIEPLLDGLSDSSIRTADVEGCVPHVYANHPREDETTRRMRFRCPNWTSVSGWSDDRLAARIVEDGIDILLDLSGHTAGNRLLALARRPAPIQCGWIGYPGTSGLDCIDYYLADRHYLPREEFQPRFTERLVHLPSVASYQPFRNAPPVGPLPALSADHVTFGSFSRRLKIGPATIALWSELLVAVPRSRLLLSAIGEDCDPEGMAALIAARGVGRERLTFVRPGAVSMPAYLKLHDRVDLCLDPIPFTGATTTCHALWQGVPTLTLAGHTAPGRLGQALLIHAGLAEFVARTPAEFLERGRFWAEDLPALANLRGSMRKRILDSPLGRPLGYGQALAGAFRTMWRRWCAGLPAEGFSNDSRETCASCAVDKSGFFAEDSEVRPSPKPT